MKAPKTEVITELSIRKMPPADTDQQLYDLLKKRGGKLSAKALWQASVFDDINSFYLQLRTELHNGWIEQGNVTVQIEQVGGNP